MTRTANQRQRDGDSDQASRVVPRSSSRATIGTPRNTPIANVTEISSPTTTAPSACCAWKALQGLPRRIEGSARSTS